MIHQITKGGACISEEKPLTSTMVNVIQPLNKPILIIVNNKTLVAQLCSEFKEFFPTMRWSTSILVCRRQKMMGLLYNVEAHTINYHLKKIFADGELDENSVIRKFRITSC